MKKKKKLKKNKIINSQKVCRMQIKNMLTKQKKKKNNNKKKNKPRVL